MKPLQVGDRVRINYSPSIYHWETGQIWDMANNANIKCTSDGSNRIIRNVTAYRIDVDGAGKHWPNGSYIAYLRSDLIPLYDGDQAADQSFSEIIESLKTERIAQ